MSTEETRMDVASLLNRMRVLADGIVPLTKDLPSAINALMDSGAGSFETLHTELLTCIDALEARLNGELMCPYCGGWCDAFIKGQSHSRTNCPGYDELIADLDDDDDGIPF